MVDGEPRPALGLLVAGDLYVRTRPPRGPAPRAPFERGRHPRPNRLLQPPDGQGGGVLIVARGEHGNDLAQRAGPTLRRIETPPLDQGGRGRIVFRIQLAALTQGRGGSET